MNYPLISEYIESIKSAEDNFDKLTHLRPVLNDDGDPIMSSGNFAVVFKMKDETDGQLYAVKCFLKEQEGRKESYQLIADAMEYVSSSFMTSIRYLDKELFVDSNATQENYFPVLQMDWVEGITLDKYIRQHIEDKNALALLAYQFSRLATWLLAQDFAHGDLKPDNILVREDGTLVLVDYDGMYVPAMEGQKARELGSPDFRHPLRTEEDFNEHIDDIALISILLSLKAIAVQPGCLDKYGAADRLLLSEKDYRDYKNCDFLKETFPSDNDELNLLYGLFLIALIKGNLSSVSFRLLGLEKPKIEKIEEEKLSTEVSEKDLKNAWTDKFGVKYSPDKKRLIEGNCQLSKYEIIKGTKVICDKALKYCWSLLNINIPDSVTQIGNNPFLGCSKLEIVKCNSTIFKVIDGMFFNCKEKKLISYIGKKDCPTIPKTITQIGALAFYDCESLQSINIPESVTQIGDSAFWCCEALQSINIPDSVTQIGNSEFKYCRSLQSIKIPDTVTQIEKNPFAGCFNLSSIKCNSTIFKVSNGMFYNCKEKKLISYIGKKNCPTIPNSVTQIGDSAFEHCKALQSIIIPNSVTQIGNLAFNNCEALQSIIIPDSVTQIGDSAFEFCDSLQKIIIPRGTRRQFEKLLPDCKFKIVEE